MKTSIVWSIFCGISLVVLSVGCSSVTSHEYTQGIIQSSRIFQRAEQASPSPASQTVVKVCCFSESRERYAGESHTLWLVYLPLFCTASSWERSNWLLWGSDKGGYKPAGLDMAEAIGNELDESGLFKQVYGPATEGQAEWLVEGDIRNLTLRTYPHLLGCSVFFAPLIGGIGLPLGQWNIEQQVHLRIVSSKTHQVAWEQTFTTQARGLIAAYYGRYPLQFGYPYDQVMRPVVNELIMQLKKVCSEAR